MSDSRETFWGRRGAGFVPRGVEPGHGLEDIDAIRQANGGDLRAKPAPVDDGQLDLFAVEDPPPPAA